mgnify:CR=1 FL=1
MSRLELLRRWIRETLMEIERAKKNQNFYLRMELEYLYNDLKKLWDK